MGKAFLLIDEMPQSCWDCWLSTINTHFCCAVNREPLEIKSARQDWCPLKAFSQKKPMKAAMNEVDEMENLYNKGWNDALSWLERDEKEEDRFY